jgi:hypothetical protein
MRDINLVFAALVESTFRRRMDPGLVPIARFAAIGAGMMAKRRAIY